MCIAFQACISGGVRSGCTDVFFLYIVVWCLSSWHLHVYRILRTVSWKWHHSLEKYHFIWDSTWWKKAIINEHNITGNVTALCVDGVPKWRMMFRVVPFEMTKGEGVGQKSFKMSWGGGAGVQKELKCHGVRGLEKTSAAPLCHFKWNGPQWENYFVRHFLK